MTNSQQPEERRRRRAGGEERPRAGRKGERAPRENRRAAASRQAAASSEPVPRPKTGFMQIAPPLFLGAAVGAMAAGAIYAAKLVPDTDMPYALIALGVSAFLTGATSRLDPRKLVGAAGLFTCVGLAVIGTRSSEAGVAIAVGAGMILAGGIHRLGRAGPDLPPEDEADRLPQ